MKQIYLAIIVALLPVWKALAQEHSVDEGKGNWTDGSTWVSWTPVTSNISTDIVVNGLVSAPSLNFNDGPDIDIADGDTLIIDGDLTMGQNNAINIGNGSLLVVIGDYSTTNNHNISNSGIMIVIGQMTLNGSNSIFNNGSLYLLGGNNLTDGDFPIGTVAANVNDIDDLNNDEPDLVTFLDTNYGTTLPVELVHFSAVAAEGQIILGWKTATETNNDYFSVERAGTDRQFTEVARVPGQGTVSYPVEYQIADSPPVQGQLYYRLKQVDFDGRQHYHPAIGVEFTSDPSILIFPNPSSDGQFHCRLPGVIEVVEYIDMGGNLHQGQVIYVHGVATVSPVNRLKRGYYVVRLWTKQRIHVADILIH
jgi:hypothetical protein